MNRSGASWMTSARVSLVMGAGRVGSSTAAAAMAQAAADRGADVLLIVIDDAPVLSMLAGVEEFDDRDHVLSEDRGRVRARRISTSKVFSDRLGESGLGGIFRRAMSGSSLPLIAAAIPGLDDLLTLSGVVELEQASAADLIVVDTPRGGRAADFLRAVEKASDVVQSPELLESAVAVQEALTDENRFQGVPVLLPDTDVVAATEVLVGTVRATKALTIRTLLANAMLPDATGSRRAHQTALVRGLSDRLAVDAIDLPWLPDGIGSPAEVRELARWMAVGS
jgi:anion-transporting  ArsA/GET3 family ATPase